MTEAEARAALRIMPAAFEMVPIAGGWVVRRAAAVPAQQVASVQARRDVAMSA